MIFIFYIFGAVLLYFSYRSCRGGLDYLNYFHAQLAQPRSHFTPITAVIAPCKGVDEGLAENLAALFKQEFPRYEIIFAVDSAEDAAVAVIERTIKNHSELSKIVSCKIVVAPKAKGSSQKIENMIAAIGTADPSSQVLVFVDSDSRVSSDWLLSLVAPLRDKTVGAATGYRWFVPRPRSIAGELRSVWNASIASSLGPNLSPNFCWGGSTAIRREVFDELGIAEKWRGTLSDDFVLTKLVKASGRTISFVPKALTASVSACTVRELFEFTTRQMKVTRVYAADLWALSLFGSALYCGVTLSALAIMFFGDAGRSSLLAAGLTLAGVAILSVGKAYLRRKAVLLVLTDYRKEISAVSQLSLWAFTPIIFLYNCVAAFFSRQITWRGIKYKLVSDSQTEIIDLTP